MKTKTFFISIITLLVIGFSGYSQQDKLTPEEAQQIAKEAYIYGFPLVLNYKTMYSYAVDKKSPEYKGDFNKLGGEARVFTPEDKAIITPNSDTPYSMAWVDLRAAPMVFTIPEIQKALEEGAKEGFSEMEEFVKEYTSDPLVSAKIFGTRAFLNKSAKENYNLDEFFILQAVAAYRGIYGNSGEEAIYPTYMVDVQGTPFDASQNKYTLIFKKGEFPPVTAFWSLTMYDGKTQLLIDNPLNRYLLNSPIWVNPPMIKQ